MTGHRAGAEPKRGSHSVGYLDLLRSNPHFRRLWIAELVSFLGDWFNTIALFAAVAELSSGTQAIAGVFIAKMLPIFAMTPVAGPLIDRFDRRKLLVATDVARAICALGLIVAYRSANLELLLALVVLMMCFAGVFIPAKTAVMPQLVPARQLGRANALSGGTWSVMLALGAALGGLVTGLVGVEVALACDALTFLVSAAVLLPLPSLQPTAGSGSTSTRRQRGFFAGLRYLRRRPYLAAVISLKSMMALAGGSLAMLPVFGTQVFPATAGAHYIGLLYAARGLGALVGSMVVPRVLGDAPRTLRRIIMPALVVTALSHLALSQTSDVWQAAAAYFGTAVGGGMIWVSSGTLGQLATANEYRGRVFSVEWGTMTLVLSGVAGFAGWLVDLTDWTVRDVALLSGLTPSIPFVLWGALLLYLRGGLARDRAGQHASVQQAEGAQKASPVVEPAKDEAQLPQPLHWRERWIGGEIDEG